MISDIVPALAGAGMKRAPRRKQEVPADGCCNETTGIVIGSISGRGSGGRTARCAAAPEDFDDQHAAATARAWRAIIDHPVRIGGVGRCRWIDRRHWGGEQLPGACHVGLAAGAGEQPVVADAVKPLWQNVEQEAPDELLGGERHGEMRTGR